MSDKIISRKCRDHRSMSEECYIMSTMCEECDHLDRLSSHIAALEAEVERLTRDRAAGKNMLEQALAEVARLREELTEATAERSDTQCDFHAAGHGSPNAPCADCERAAARSQPTRPRRAATMSDLITHLGMVAFNHGVFSEQMDPERNNVREERARAENALRTRIAALEAEVARLREVERLAREFMELSINPSDNGVGELEARARLFHSLSPGGQRP